MKAKESVQLSNEKVYENPENSSLKFSKWQKEHDKARTDACKQRLEESETGLNSTNFLSAVSSGFLKMLKTF